MAHKSHIDCKNNPRSPDLKYNLAIIGTTFSVFKANENKWVKYLNQVYIYLPYITIIDKEIS